MSLGYWETVIEQQVDGPTLTAAAAASCLVAASPVDGQVRKILPSDFFRYKGQQLLIEATGRVSCAVTTPGTGRFSVTLGGTTVFDGLAMNLNVVAKVNVGWWLRILLTCEKLGVGTAQLFGQGKWESEAVVGSPLPTAGGSGVLLLPVATAPALGGAFDSTIAQLLDLVWTPSLSTASLTLHQFNASTPN